MSEVVTLDAIPNQSFSIQLDGVLYDLSFNAIPDGVAATIVRDTVPIVTGQRCVAGFGLIPYRYLESGNFIFLTENDEIPDYTKFGDTQTLLFYSASELEVIRA